MGTLAFVAAFFSLFFFSASSDAPKDTNNFASESLIRFLSAYLVERRIDRIRCLRVVRWGLLLFVMRLLTWALIYILLFLWHQLPNCAIFLYVPNFDIW